jgi:hypothetical protein
MRIPKLPILVAVAAAAILAQTADVEAGSSKRRIHRGGEHYDTVMANYTRRCTDLDGQFSRARADRPDSAQVAEATALYQQGVAHCSGGARLQGIEELEAAIRMIGAIPRVNL